ncbi:MAG: DUF6398 domain-containing protein [Clostridium sp.]
MQELSNVLAGKYEEVVEKISSFSNEHLNDGYKSICIDATKALFSNNQEQVKKGKSSSWAAGIVHAIGTVNNLFDAKSKPYIKALDLYKEFGVSSSTGSSKSKEIRNLLALDENSEQWIVRKNEETVESTESSAQNEAAVTAQQVEDKNNNSDEFKFAVKRNFVVAQKIVNKAWSEKNYKSKAKYAKEALSIYEDCPDAYIILSKDISLNNDEKKALLEKAVQSAENVLGITELKDTDPRIFKLPVAELFFGAKYTLALHLWEMKERDEAIKNLNDVLVYNKKDSFLARGFLTSWLLIEGRLEEAEEILSRCEHDYLLDTIYNRAALLFKTGKMKEAESALRRAYRRNPFVMDYLLGAKAVKDVKVAVRPGSSEEAMRYAKLGVEVWKGSEMVEWLKSKKKDFQMLNF